MASTRINRYELGVHQPDLTTVQRLADELNVPAAFLFALDEKLASLIVIFERLPAREKDRLLKSLESGGS